jgi:hypothetical protein
MFDVFFAVPFNSYTVQHLNVSGFAAVQVAQVVGSKADKKTVKTVQNPSMLIIGKKGLTVKAQKKENTVKVGFSSTIVRFISHDGAVQEVTLRF